MERLSELWRLWDPPPPPPPPWSRLLSLTLGNLDWASTTLETKLIAALVLLSLTIAASSLGNQRAVASSARPPVLHGAVALLLMLLFCSPGSIDALRLMLWSPALALDVPPGIVLVVLCSALVLSVSFTTITYPQAGATHTWSATVAATAAAPAPSSASTLPSASSAAQLLLSRRSIFPKDFSGSSVPRGVIERALASATWAPTHGKTQPWRFVVFYGGDAVAHFETLKAAALQRALVGSPDALASALQKMRRKAADVAKCGAIVAIVLKRVPNAKGVFMPEWEDMCAVACAVQNLHLHLTAEGYCGYWSSGGVGGWAEDSEVRSLVGASGDTTLADGSGGGGGAAVRDRIMGWFHIGASDAAGKYNARRDPIATKVTWILE